MRTLLKIEDLHVSYGAVRAIKGISLEVNDGELVSLIGANGAGKPTTLHTITGGEQQMLAMGRALMTEPKMLLLDEPSMGLSPILVKEIFSMIKTLHSDGITILLVEQNAKMALSISDRAYVLETGLISMSGKAQDLLHDDKVRRAYLGA